MRYSTLLTFPSNAGQRKPAREDVVAISRVRELGSLAATATLKNFSVTGCCLTGVDLPAHGEVAHTWLAAAHFAPPSSGPRLVRSAASSTLPCAGADMRRLKP